MLTIFFKILIDSLVEASLGIFVDEKKAQQLKEKCLPVEGIAVVAGRTDKGVTALQQVCSFCMLSCTIIFSLKHVIIFLIGAHYHFIGVLYYLYCFVCFNLHDQMDHSHNLLLRSDAIGKRT